MLKEWTMLKCNIPLRSLGQKVVFMALRKISNEVDYLETFETEIILVFVSFCVWVVGGWR